MIRNYLLIALRNFQRQKLFALLNMFGLALGIASAILIFLYVSDELQFDTMHSDADNTYRIGVKFTNPDGRVFDNTVSPGIFVKHLRDTRTEVIDAARIDYIGYPTSLHHKDTDRIILTEEIRWAEPGFDRILSFDLVKGNRSKMFDAHNTMVVSEAGARKLFGDVDPIGKVITVKHNWATFNREIDLAVTGVYRDYPANSHFKPEYILNIHAFRAVRENFDAYLQGARLQDAGFFENYVVLNSDADVAALEEDLRVLGKQMTESDSGFVAAGWKMDVFMKRLTDLHFDQENLWEPGGVQGDEKYLAIFSAVALLILLIACINYMNLATARSSRRAREVGLRKALGSKRSQVAKQFFYESTLMTLASVVMALILVVIFLEPFNQVAHKTFTAASFLNPYMIGIVLVVVSFMAFISGSYPALYLSAFRPSEVLKGQATRGSGAEMFRKMLVAIQYSVSLILIISTLIVIRQMDHMQNSKLNQAGNQLLSIRYGGIAPQEKFAAFKNAVLGDKDIAYVTMANHLPRLNYFGYIGANARFTEFPDKEMQWNQLQVDFDFPKTFGLEFVAGRDFISGNLADSSAIILNEAAVKALGQPVEKVLGTSLVVNNNTSRTYTVIGVVKDFPFRSMHQAIEPLLLNPQLHFIDRIAYVKLPVGKFQEKIRFLEKTWKEIYPNVGFDYWFVSDEFNRMYLAESRVSSLAKSFAVLAILITALGVFGLASYTAEQKTKEVGIRKVLGAAVKQVVVMFLVVFLKIFLIASAIAVPIAYYVADYWLEGFAYRSHVSPFVFIISLLGLLLITLITVGYETWKAASSNPVHSLRME